MRTERRLTRLRRERGAALLEVAVTRALIVVELAPNEGVLGRLLEQSENLVPFFRIERIVCDAP